MSFVNLVSHPFPLLTSQRRKVQTVWNGAPRHEIDYVAQVLEILSLKGHQNWIIGLKITAILQNRWVLPIGGVAA